MSPAVPALLVAAALLVAWMPAAGALRVRSLSGGPAPLPSVLPVAVLVALATLGPLAAAAVLGGAALQRVARRRAAAARAARANADALPGLCRAAAAELRAGASPERALSRAAADAPTPVLAYVVSLTAGAPPDPPPDPPPGAERLRAVAALWAVAGDAGAGLADGLDRLAAALAAERRHRADVAAQLAGPRASAAVLAALPAFGLLLGAGLGARPLRFLATPPGMACLVVAAALNVAGVWWVRRITERAGR